MPESVRGFRHPALIFIERQVQISGLFDFKSSGRAGYLSALLSLRSHLELGQQFGKTTAFFRETCSCGVHLFDHRGVLLRDLIHMVHGCIDFGKTGCLFLGGNCDRFHMLVYRHNQLRDFLQTVAGIVDQSKTD